MWKRRVPFRAGASWRRRPAPGLTAGGASPSTQSLSKASRELPPLFHSKLGRCGIPNSVARLRRNGVLAAERGYGIREKRSQDRCGPPRRDDARAVALRGGYGRRCSRRAIAVGGRVVTSDRDCRAGCLGGRPEVMPGEQRPQVPVGMVVPAPRTSGTRARSRARNVAGRRGLLGLHPGGARRFGRREGRP